MKKLFLLCAMVCALGMMTACKSGTADNKINNVIASEEQEYRAMDAADKELKDSIGYSQYNSDENGVCEGAPDIYSAKNKEEEGLLSAFKGYYKAVMKKDVAKAKSYICPKVISLTREEFPQYTDDEVEDAVTGILAEFSEYQENMRTHFEGFKKAVPVVSQLYKLQSKEGCLLYSVHYSIVILCTADNENYSAWHLPMFMYAASYDMGEHWYFIELVEDTDEVLKDFR